MALNQQQLDIVDFVVNGQGSANVVARAGTGKTFTVVEGIVRAISEHSLGTAAVTAFNKSAATEFETRIAATGLDASKIFTGTMHSFGFRAWRYANQKVKVDGFKVRNLMRRDYEFITQVDKLVGLAKQYAFGVVCEVEDTSRWYELIERFDIEANGNSAEIINKSIEIYNESLAQLPFSVDFNDMILAPLIRPTRIIQNDFVIVDEAQDMNASRRLLAFKMMKSNGRLIAVGDPKQAIYGFTGADSDSMDQVRNALNSVTFPLSITYRCPKSVVREANKIVPDLQAHESAPEGVVRTLAFEEEIDGIKRYWYDVEMPLTVEDAALCRNTKPLVEEAYKLITHNVACRVEGRDIGEGLISLATKWRRITFLSALRDKIEDYEDGETKKWNAKDNAQRSQAVEDKCETLMLIIDNLLAHGLETVDDLVSHIRNLFGDTPEGERPKVFTLSTIHKAKGREWNRVYLLHRNKTLPSRYATKPWELDSESNLEYVAQTRSKSELIYVD